jgi:hypothetical protein
MASFGIDFIPGNCALQNTHRDGPITAAEGSDQPLCCQPKEHAVARRRLQQPLSFKRTIFPPADGVQKAGSELCSGIDPARLMELQDARRNNSAGVLR